MLNVKIGKGYAQYPAQQGSSQQENLLRAHAPARELPLAIAVAVQGERGNIHTSTLKPVPHDDFDDKPSRQVCLHGSFSSPSPHLSSSRVAVGRDE